MPVAEGEVHVVLIEPKTTLNTGNVRNERTRVVATLYEAILAFRGIRASGLFERSDGTILSRPESRGQKAEQ